MTLFPVAAPFSMPQYPHAIVLYERTVVSF